MVGISGFPEEHVRVGGGENKPFEHTAQRRPGKQPDQEVPVDEHDQQGGGGGAGGEGEQPQ